MYRIYFFWLLLLPGTIIRADHFRGGTITWKPISNNVTVGSTVSIMITQTYTWTLSQVGCNSSMITAQSPLVNTGTKAGSGINLMCNDSCSTSGGYIGNEVPVVGYCTDFSTTLNLTVSQRSDIVNLTAGAHFTATFAADGGWQALALGSSGGWSLSSLIDLRVRSDNGLINTPPVATCMSYISVPVSVQQSIQIPVLDADNDVLRCRFANGSSECVNTCPPGSLPLGTSLSSSCILTITGTTVGDYYLVAIQVEDFITNTSTTPMSSVPLQFLIYVYAVPNCTVKPLLTADVSSGNCHGVQVGVNFTMTFTVINQCASERTINDIPTLSFPIMVKSALVQNTSNTSLWSMNITWMPMVSQVGPQVFCAVATDNASVQSDQYCMTLFVGLSSVPLCPGATVTPTTMMQTSTDLMTVTSQHKLQDSTEAGTTMDITSLSINETSTMTISSSLPSSTVKAQEPINWGLIIGLSLLALALALCCLLCCCYHLIGFRAKRRRRKKIKELDHTLEWKQGNGKAPEQSLRRHNQKENYTRGRESSVTIISDLRTPNRVTVSRVNLSENSLIDNKGNATSKQPSSPARTLAQTIDKNLRYNSSISQNSSDSTAFLSFASTSAKMNRVTVTKVSRFGKSALASRRPTITISGRTQSKASQRTDLNYSERERTSSQRPSTVSVTRVKRSSSIGRINHTTTVSSNNNLNRVLVTKLT